MAIISWLSVSLASGKQTSLTIDYNFSSSSHIFTIPIKLSVNQSPQMAHSAILEFSHYV